jgi:hypothetical protein
LAEPLVAVRLSAAHYARLAAAAAAASTKPQEEVYHR